MESELHRENQKKVVKQFAELGVPMSGGGSVLPYRVSVTEDVITLDLRCSAIDADRAIAVVQKIIAEAKRPR
jgi:hypothetical protein